MLSQDLYSLEGFEEEINLKLDKIKSSKLKHIYKNNKDITYYQPTPINE